MYTELKMIRITPELLLKSYVDRRLHFALSRFGSRIGRVTVTISLVSSGRPGDLRCRIIADMRPFGAITAEGTDLDAHSAIDRAIGRLLRRCDSKCVRQRNGAGRRTSIRIPTQHLAA
jgi:ribosome-associated translation inhibitor RaiA